MCIDRESLSGEEGKIEMNVDIWGVNAGKVNTTMGLVKNSYDALVSALIGDTQTFYVNKIAGAWCSPNAQEVMNNFKLNIRKILRGVASTYNSINNALKLAGEAILKQQGDNSSLDIIPRLEEDSLDTSNILAIDSQGNVKMDVTELLSANQNLFSFVAPKINSALDLAIQSVSDSGFLGGDMQRKLTSSLEQIKTEISTAFTTVTTNVKKEINDSKTGLQSQMKEVASAFTVQNNVDAVSSVSGYNPTNNE